jgi:gliding motility-associated-like protein
MPQNFYISHATKSTRLMYLCSMLRAFILAIILMTGISSQSVKAQAPTTAAKNIVFNTVYCQQLNFSWTNGNGAVRLVLARKANTINAFPVDNQFYTGRDSFGLGSKLGSDVFVVYRGTGNSATVRNLESNTTYYFAVIEYNFAGSNFYYLNTPYPEASVTMENLIADFNIVDDYQCLQGNNFSFTNTSSNTLSLSMTYLWDFGNMTTSTATSPSYTYSKGGVYNVKLEVLATGCYSKIIRQDTVVIPAITDFILDPLPGNDSIQCLLGNFYKFKNTTVVPPVGGTSYDETTFNWTYGDNSSSSGYNAQKKYTYDGLFEVKLVTKRRISPNSTREYCFDSTSKYYRVLTPPLSAGKIVLSDTALCLTGNVFNFSHTAPDITTSWWKFGNNDSLQGNPVNYSYSAAGKYYITLNVVDSKGCRDVGFDSVKIYTQPNNYFTGLKAAYCQGEPSVKLIPNLPGGTFSGNGVNSLDSTFTPNVLGTYEVYYIYKQGDCIDSARVSVTVNPKPFFSLGNDTILCVGDAINYDIGITGIGYLWSNGQNTQMASASNGGIFWGDANDGKCTFRDSVNIRQIKPPSFNLGNDTSLCGGYTVKLNVTSDLAVYSWNDGNTDPERTISQSGIYKVNVTNACGSLRDSIDVYIEPYACTIFIVNAISPNQDGQNERFIPLGNYNLINIRIYDRWGRKIYDSPSTDGWDGKDEGEIVPIGTYFYIVEYTIAEGNTYALKQAAGPLHVLY